MNVHFSGGILVQRTRPCSSISEYARASQQLQSRLEELRQEGQDAESVQYSRIERQRAHPDAEVHRYYFIATGEDAIAIRSAREAVDQEVERLNAGQDNAQALLHQERSLDELMESILQKAKAGKTGLPE